MMSPTAPRRQWSPCNIHNDRPQSGVDEQPTLTTIDCKWTDTVRGVSHVLSRRELVSFAAAVTPPPLSDAIPPSHPSEILNRWGCHHCLAHDDAVLHRDPDILRHFPSCLSSRSLQTIGVPHSLVSMTLRRGSQRRRASSKREWTREAGHLTLFQYMDVQIVCLPTRRHHINQLLPSRAGRQSYKGWQVSCYSDNQAATEAKTRPRRLDAADHPHSRPK
ncbi:hypothetical protein B0I35DRAFT_250441 [Stachybotrys elegans]|uniref:Uncharacterized protein n=1 Tax=Stachybotrys elegans TaxID=80388 RepID=A0A8K0SVT1_9HYPO|nr:hypothetical protein B0I35DRAFT_250441 [Stachybotrys elegans]